MGYRTSDTPLAAYLITQGNLPAEIDYTEPRYEVVFAGNADSIRKSASEYSAGLAQVEPIVYNRILRKLNRILRNQIQWEDD